MSYIGSTPTTQNFIAGTDSFNGTGSATNFTLSRFVNSTNDIQVVVNNVVQYPPNYSVSGNTLTISPAPSSGTNNVYVRYLSTTLQSVGVGDLSVSTNKIQDNAITTAKIAAGAVIPADLSTGAPSWTTSGAVILQGGDTGANGIGITFPATQSASSNANTLDDYEEGTWTPTDTSGAGLTLTGITSARYVKIGKRVFCDLEVLYPTTANTNFISIGGLPYVSENTGDYGSSACMNDANLNLWGFAGTNSTSVTVYKQAATFTLARNSEVSAKTLYISIAYNAVN